MISLLVPTRGRPHNIERFSTAVRDTCSGESVIEVVWYVDEDDEPSEQKIKEIAQSALEDGTCVRHSCMIGPRITLSNCWNEAWMWARGDVFGLMGDDVVIRTQSWDLMVERAFAEVPDRIALVYGRDGFRDEVHASHPFISQQWAQQLDRVSPPYFSADMNDVWLFEVAKSLGRAVFLPDLFTQHLHPDDPSLCVEVDQTHRDRMLRRDIDKTHDLYMTPNMVEERQRDVRLLRGVMR